MFREEGAGVGAVGFGQGRSSGSGSLGLGGAVDGQLLRRDERVPSKTWEA